MNIESLLPVLPDNLRWDVVQTPDKIYLKIIEDRTFLWFWKKSETVRDGLILDVDSIDESFAKLMIEMTVINMLEGLL